LTGLLEEKDHKIKSMKSRYDKNLSTPSPTIPNEQKTAPEVISSVDSPSFFSKETFRSTLSKVSFLRRNFSDIQRKNYS
jgi:hypothetical protein